MTNTPQQIRCQNCGASMVPKKDNRIKACEYCGAELQVQIDSKDLAAGLGLDLSDTNKFFDGLVKALHGNIGECTKAQQDGARVVIFEVKLDPHLYVLRREQGEVIAQYKKLVRGVALKTATHPLDRWMEMLMKSLSDYANENARVAQALNMMRVK